MDEIKRFFSDNDRFARHCGIELTAVEPGCAKAQMVIQDYHRNGVGIVHGRSHLYAG